MWLLNSKKKLFTITPFIYNYPGGVGVIVNKYLFHLQSFYNQNFFIACSNYILLMTLITYNVNTRSQLPQTTCLHLPQQMNFMVEKEKKNINN